MNILIALLKQICESQSEGFFSIRTKWRAIDLIFILEGVSFSKMSRSGNFRSNRKKFGDFVQIEENWDRNERISE